jgi:chemotaxis protein histidine kinase CheA
MENLHLPRAAYAREMGELEQDVLDMASRAESMVTRAVDALQRLDTGLAREVMRSRSRPVACGCWRSSSRSPATFARSARS